MFIVTSLPRYVSIEQNHYILTHN